MPTSTRRGKPRFISAPLIPKMSSGVRGGRVRPSEIAADTKRNFIPLVSANFSETFPPYSVLYPCPTEDLAIPRRTLSTRPPMFILERGDPVSRAIHYSIAETQSSQASGGGRVRVPFISAANERRPGGDWETGSAGYEEKLCRRSNLSATLSTPWPGTGVSSHYPIPSGGAILSNSVVVYRGPPEGYERLDSWYDLPVVSAPPTRWPKLKENGTKYSFAQERDMMRDRIRGVLRVCLYNDYRRIVVGDFGLGNGYRNPPREVAEIWRDLVLFDPDLRGQFHYVVFVFDDAGQSTSRLILDELSRRQNKENSRRSGSSGSGGMRHGETSSLASSAWDASGAPSDMSIFEQVFHPAEIARVVSQPDPRYGLDMITS